MKALDTLDKVDGFLQTLFNRMGRRFKIMPGGTNLDIARQVCVAAIIMSFGCLALYPKKPTWTDVLSLASACVVVIGCMANVRLFKVMRLAAFPDQGHSKFPFTNEGWVLYCTTRCGFVGATLVLYALTPLSVIALFAGTAAFGYTASLFIATDYRKGPKLAPKPARKRRKR